MSLCRVDIDEVERYCCLGVLYDQLAGAAWDQDPTSLGRATDWGIPEDPNQPPPPEDRSLPHSGVDSGMLPEWVLSKVGLQVSEQEHLASMNDDGQSFSEIADWIEENC
jgi:hypothetical protein